MLNRTPSSLSTGFQTKYNLTLTKIESTTPVVNSPDLITNERVDVGQLLGAFTETSPRILTEHPTHFNYQLVPLASSHRAKQDPIPPAQKSCYKTLTLKFLSHPKRAHSLEAVGVNQTHKFNAPVQKESRIENSEIFNFLSHKVKPETLKQLLAPIDPDFTPISFRGNKLGSPRMTFVNSSPRRLLKKSPVKSHLVLNTTEPSSPRNVFDTVVNEEFKRKQPLTSRASPLRIKFKETSGVSPYFQLPRIRPMVKKLPQLLGMNRSKSLKKYLNF